MVSAFAQARNEATVPQRTAPNQARCTSPRQNQLFPNKRRSTNRTPSELIPTPSPTGHQPAGRELRNPESP